MKWLCLLCLACLSLPAWSARVNVSDGMVVSEQRLASQVGADILRQGGNAIDAAVAVGYALAVVNPCCGNIGGGGFMLIHLASGKTIFLNFRERAPRNAYPNMYLTPQGQLIPGASLKGYLAVGVPGTVLGLDTALQRYGHFSRQRVMQPAIRLAREGYRLSPYAAKQWANFTNDFRQQPNIAAIFLKNGHAYAAGDRFIQTDLAKTLQHIADQGPDYFYRGPIAKAIVAASQAQGGLLSATDFANYNVYLGAPVRCDYHGYTLLSAALPSSGGIALCEMLNILENFSLPALGYRTEASVRTIVEAMGDAFVDRNDQLGDSRFVSDPVAKLLSPVYAHTLSQQIKASTGPLHQAAPQTNFQLTDTTHYSVVDGAGNAVSLTYTLNGFFGAQVMAGHTGFFLNNEMNDFTSKPGAPNKFGLIQEDKNNIQPMKQPLSSITPTLIFRHDKLFMVLGSPGGPRIITSLLLTILQVIDYHQPLEEAIAVPRFHYQASPNVIFIEPQALSQNVIAALAVRGYSVTTQASWGAVEAIKRDGSFIEGVNDARRPDGAAIAG